MVESRLPAGTVTFLFTDIEGSTELLQRLGDRYASVLEEHRRVLRAAFEAHGGVEVETEGDSFFVAFARGSDGVGAAVDAQRRLAGVRWPAGVDVRVRMGLHTGQPMVVSGGYVGIDVHRAARIMSSAHGGQIVLSQTTHDLVTEVPVDGVELRDLGEHRLKDLTRSGRLFDVVAHGLRTSFPPLRTLENRPTNLPTFQGPLVGRDQDVAAIHELLHGTPRTIVTLTGPGGVGKTRLALQTAAEEVERFPSGVFFANLSGVERSSLVLPAIQLTIGAPPSPHDDTAQQLGRYLRERRMLVVLDNFEQLLDAASDVAALSSVAPEVRWLVTSRAPLRLEIEAEYPVAPLSVPDPRRRVSTEAASAYASVQLFLERAAAANRGFSMDDENVRSVVEVCRRLDGLPLALELAAARVKLLSPRAILDRLDDQFRLLAAGRRDAPERHQTIRAAIHWSHGLLDDAAQDLFARLAVFDGGWTLDTAEKVLGVDSFDLLDGLTSLVENSLVQNDHSVGDRFRFLETIHAYAAERFQELSGCSELSARHARYFFELAYRVRNAWTEPVLIFDQLEPEVPNFHRAVRELTHAGEFDLAGRIVGHLGWYWQGASRYEEGLALVDYVRQSARGVLDDRSAGLLALTKGALLYDLGQVGIAQTELQQAAQLLPGQDEEADYCWTVKTLGWIALSQGDAAGAQVHFEQAARLAGESAVPVVPFECAWGLGTVAAHNGNVEEARTHWGRALEEARRNPGPLEQYYVRVIQAEIAQLDNRPNDAVPLYRANLEAALDQGEAGARMLADAALRSGIAELESGHAQHAATALQLAMPVILEQRGLFEVAGALLLGAAIAAASDDYVTASELMGVSSNSRARGGISYDHFERALYSRLNHQCGEHLGADKHRELLATAAAISTEDALSRLMDVLVASTGGIRTVAAGDEGRARSGQTCWPAEA